MKSFCHPERQGRIFSKGWPERIHRLRLRMTIAFGLLKACGRAFALPYSSNPCDWRDIFMELKTLCQEIDLPAAAAGRVMEEAGRLDLAALPVEGLFHREGWASALEALEKALAPDPDGCKILALMLRCCDRTWERYQAQGLSPKVFLDTMGCFSRFVRECRVHRGYWGFDRAFWTPRQLSGVLFRIGTLEYELLPNGTISLHIPSDASLEDGAVEDSFRRARALLNEKFPQWREAPVVCASWLLSPELSALLPEKSRILAFQRRFAVTGVEESEDYREWVFKDSHSPLEALPENTTLQKNLKAFLLSGRPFHIGAGRFLEPK